MTAGPRSGAAQVRRRARLRASGVTSEGGPCNESAVASVLDFNTSLAVIIPPCPGPRCALAMHTCRFVEVFWIRLEPPPDYKRHTSKFYFKPAYAEPWRELSMAEAQLDMTRPCPSSMSSITNHLLKTADVPAAISK